MPDDPASSSSEAEDNASESDGEDEA